MEQAGKLLEEYDTVYGNGEVIYASSIEEIRLTVPALEYKPVAE